MLRPRKMRKIRAIALKTVSDRLVRDLHEAGIVHITKTRLEGLDQGRPSASFDRISSLLLKLRSAFAIMEEAGVPRKMDARAVDAERAVAEAESFDLDVRLKSLSNERSRIIDRIREIDSLDSVLAKTSRFGRIDLSSMRTRTIDHRIGECANPKAMEAKLARIPDTDMITDPQSKACMVIFSKARTQEVDAILSESRFVQLDIPEGAGAPSEQRARIQSEKSQLMRKDEALKAEMSRISAANIDRVRVLIDSLETVSQRAEISSRFSSSGSVHVISGWVQATDKDKLDSIISRYGDQAYLEEAVSGHEDMPPTVLDNPKTASPFEFITKSYSLPNYYEIDPTLAYLVFLPILYGMIVGDVIYGLISIGLAFVFMKKFERSEIMRSVSKIWLYGAFTTMIFGVIFDEWMGLSHIVFLNELIGSWIGVEFLDAPLYSGLHRLHNVLTLIAISALVGMVHLAVGFIIGAVNEWNHNRKHSFAKVAWLGVELGGLMLMLALVGMADPAFSTAGLVVLLISIVILAVTEGIVGIVELPGLVGNILSYARIAAVGIVGVVIAEMINELLRPSPDKGLVVALILIPIYVVLHVINTFIAMFEAIIQGGRLNIVEFKSKFLHGGGMVFEPFSLKKN